MRYDNVSAVGLLLSRSTETSYGFTSVREVDLNVKTHDTQKYPSPLIIFMDINVIKGVIMQYKQILLSTVAVSH